MTNVTVEAVNASIGVMHKLAHQYIDIVESENIFDLALSVVTSLANPTVAFIMCKMGLDINKKNTIYVEFCSQKYDLIAILARIVKMILQLLVCGILRWLLGYTEYTSAKVLMTRSLN